MPGKITENCLLRKFKNILNQNFEAFNDILETSLLEKTSSKVMGMAKRLSSSVTNSPSSGC